MRTIHESKIEVAKVQFKPDSIKIDYLLETNNSPEAYSMECTASPHPDLVIARENLIKKRLLEIMDLPAPPAEEGWRWEDRIYLAKIEHDADKGQLKFEYLMSSPAFAKPIKCTTDWSNDFVLEQYQEFFDEVACYITAKKRAQSDLFHDEENAPEPEEQKQLGPAKKQLMAENPAES